MAHSVEYSLKKAKNMLSKGNLEAAEKAFQSILHTFPGNNRARDGLNYCELMKNQKIGKNKINDNLSMISECYSAGNHTSVIDIFEKLSKSEENSDILIKAGASYGLIGKYDKARECFEKVILLHPNDPAPYNNIGTLQKMQNNVENAMEYYSMALEKNPKHFDSLKNLAFCFEHFGELDKAVSNLELAIEESPDSYNLINHLAGLYSKLDNKDKAEICYKKALDIKADFTPAINNLGNIYYARNEYENAIEKYEQALKIKPDYSDAYNNLGNVLKDMGFLDEAIHNYERAIELQPTKPELYSNLSVVLKDKYLIRESLEIVEKAISLKDNFYDALWNKALAQLAGKDFQNGWESYEWRWKATNFDSTYLKTEKPVWSGSKERVLIWQEQGIGDQIMFSTMFEEFAELCSLAIFQVDGRLLPIFRRTFPQFYFIPGDKKLSENEYDSHIPMGSLPKFLRTSQLDFERATPTKLKANTASAQKIREAFRMGDRTLIGISWKSMNKSTGWMRSLSLSDFIEPFKDKDVELVNLQYGDCKDEIKEAYDKTGIAVKSVNEIDTFTNIDHLASLIHCCDRIITIDNSTIHLAASMGKSSDLLLPFITDWRWSGGEKHSSWYDCLNVHKAPYGVHLKDCITELIDSCFKQ